MKFTMKQAANYRGLTVDKIAKALGVSKATVTAYFQMDTVPRFDVCLKFSYLVDMPLNNIIFLRNNLI